jgi:flagellar assembly protein FliH
MSDQSPAADRDRWQTWQMDALGRDEPLSTDDPDMGRRELLRKQAFQQKLELQKLKEKTLGEAQQAGHAAGLEQGYAQGLSEGREAAAVELQEQIARTLQPLLELCQNFEQALGQMDQHIARQLTRVALDTARQLAGEALTAQPEQVISTVRAMLSSNPDLSGKPRLHLNPDDLQLVQDSLGEQLDVAGWVMHADPNILPGGCRVTSASGELDATRQTRWEMLNGDAGRLLDQSVAALGEPT